MSSGRNGVMDVPRIISVDDHVLEPPDLWQRRLPSRLRDEGPRLVRAKGRLAGRGGWQQTDEGGWADVWHYQGFDMAIIPGFAAAGKDQNWLGAHWDPMIYDDMLPGCYEQSARLADMDRNHTEASLSFPTFPRFCGQTFLEHGSRELGLACVQAYNDWMIEEWCGDAGRGRLIPLTLIPLWDPELAAAEVRRCAGKGSHAICFSENPVPNLKLPSIHTTHWDPLFAACEETGTVVNVHIGSSSTFPVTSSDAPRAVSLALTYQGSAHALSDWLTCGALDRFPTLSVALSEGQVGWIPYILERLDQVWNERPVYGNLEALTKPPSAYFRDQVFGCVYDDVAGLRLRDSIGMSQIMFEVDYPHGDSTWPHTLAVVEKIAHEAGLTDGELYQLVRGNAIRCYGLDRFGITA